MTDVTETSIYNSRYEIIRQIARGGMAEVYLARDLQLHRSVALKVLFRELSTDQAFVQRFRHEAQSAANLSHPNIVSVYDWGESEADSTYFIVMEYVDGDPLSKLIRSRGPLDAVRAAEIGSDIASGLGYAHSHGVIHRDVKPGNVIVTQEGTAKVADFGIARGHNTDSSLTQTGAVMGTATYFSPEQAKGEKVDARSDIYSLGIVLFEMVTGKPPFTGDNPIAIATKHVQEIPKAPTDLDPTIPEAFEAIVMKAIAKSPSNRFASAEELHDDLDRFIAGDGVSAPAYDPSITAYLESGAPTTIVTPKNARTRIGAGQTNGTGPVDAVPATGKRIAVWIVAMVVLLVLLGLGGYFLVSHFSSGGAVHEFDVPNVVGMALPSAEAKLTPHGLTWKVVAVSSADPPSTVVSEDPPYPTPVARGAVITLGVSRGGQAALPSQVGSNIADAEAALKKLGFKVDLVSKTIPCSQVAQFPTPPDIGTVLDQKPVVASAPVGSTVTLTVSQGVAVPNVTGQPSSAASNELGQCQLNVGTTSNSLSPSGSSIPTGNVISTNPVAGSLVNPDSNVDLTVSSGQGVQVPNVKGESQSQAESDITGAQLAYTVQSQSVTDPSEDGFVIAQNPPGGTHATANSTVTITVGKASSPTSSTTTSSTTLPLGGGTGIGTGASG